jgi:hypothetical protein
VAAQNFSNLLGQVVLYSVVGMTGKYILCKVEKINRHLVTTPLDDFHWINTNELPSEYRECQVVYNY